MRMATGLAVIGVGAILAFAVTGHPSFLNIQVAGWVIMLTGLAGMVIPQRGYGWMRRRLVYRRDGTAAYPVAATPRQPRYLMLNPGAAPPPGTHLPDDHAAAPGRQPAGAGDTSPLFTEETVEEMTEE